MINTTSLKKNYTYKLLYDILSMITPFITAPYVSRILGADGIGIYSYVQSYMTYFTMFAMLGTSSYGMREIARCRDDRAEYSKKFWEIEILTVFTTLICLAAWMVLIVISQEYNTYFIALFPMLFAVVFDISWFYTGHEKIAYTVFWNSVCKIAGIISIFVFIRDRGDLALYIFISALITLIGNISMWIFLPKMLVRVDYRTFEFRRHLKETIVYFIPTIATSIYTVLDKMLIGLITHDEYQNGYYEQANKVIGMAKTAVFTSINSVFSARMSYLFAGDNTAEIKEKIELTLDYILLLGYGAVFGIIAVAKDFVPLFFGDGYEPVIKLLYMMAPLVVIIGISNCLGAQYYTPAGLRRQSTRYIIAGSFVNLIANMLLIPFLGAYGAVLGSIAAELAITALYLENCGEYLKLRYVANCSYKRIASGVIMVFAIQFVRRINMNSIVVLALEIFLGVTVYFGILIIFKDRLIMEGINKFKGR